MQFTTSFAWKAALLLTTAVNVDAFWRMPCRSRSGLARVDPLVSFGTESSHVHAIHGSSGFSTTSTYSDLMAGQCTSCQVSEDKSAYWTPALYFKSASTGQFQLVDQIGGMLAYYLLYPNVGNTSLSAFPQGFRMIAGDTNTRNFSYPVPDLPKSNWSGNLTEQAFLEQAALGFNCLNYAGAPEGSLFRHFLPDKAYLDANCKDGVRFELMFPSCWNGKDIDSPNHKDHMAYPSLVMTGNCPDGFPIRLVSLFYETIWNTYEFVGQDGEFVIANGDPTGFGYHGDFTMGWDESFLQNAVNTCTNPSGQITDCPLFSIQDPSVYSNCNITLPSALVNENVVSGFTTLPGNQEITTGPGYANDVVAGGAGSVPPPAGAGAQPSANTNLPGAILEEAAPATVAPVAVAPAAPPAAPSTTPPPPPPPPKQSAVGLGPAPSYFSTAYTTTGNEVLEVLWVEDYVTVTAPQSTTTIMALPQKKRRHFHQHRNHGRR